MNEILEYFKTINLASAISVLSKILLVIVALLVSLWILKILLGRLEKILLKKHKLEGEPPSETQKRVETIIKLIRQAVGLVMWGTAILIIITEIGIDIGPILASVGIIGLAVGFGAQNLVRDFISGFFILLENQVRVGDVAVINGTGGLVEELNFRTIVLRDLAGVVHVFPNGTITTLSNMTREWSAYVFEIGIAYKENTDKVIEVMKTVGQEMMNDEEYKKLILEEPEIFGVDKFADSSVNIKGRIKTKPIKQWQVGRQYLRRIKLAFDKEGIEIPFPHRTLYFGEASKPIELQLMEKYGRQN